MPIPKPDPCTHPDPLERYALEGVGVALVVKVCRLCGAAWLPGKIQKIDLTLDFDFGDDDDGVDA
jgi:hypothetical protein